MLAEHKHHNPYLDGRSTYSRYSVSPSPLLPTTIHSSQNPTVITSVSSPYRTECYEIDIDSPSKFIRYPRGRDRSHKNCHNGKSYDSTYNRDAFQEEDMVKRNGTPLTRVESIDLDRNLGAGYVRYVLSRRLPKNFALVREESFDQFKADPWQFRRYLVIFAQEPLNLGLNNRSNVAVFQVFGSGIKRVHQFDHLDLKCPTSASNGNGYCYHFPSRSIYSVGSTKCENPAKDESYRLSPSFQVAGPALKNARKEHGTLCLGDFIITAGGRGKNDQVLSSVEMSLVQDTQKTGISSWRELEPLPRGTYGNSMASSIYGSFYSIGGADSLGKSISWVYQFDLKSGRWSTSTPMNQARSFFMSCCYESKVFVAGGVGTDNDLLQSLEVYDVSLNKWTMLTSMPRLVSRGQMMATQGKIFVFPCAMKRNGRVSYESIQIYHIDKDEWHVDAQILDLPNVLLVALTDD